MSSTPTTLGKYQIIREIARSNDIVYEAYDPLMNRRVALKELAIPGGSTQVQRDERLRRFQREVKAAGSLAHANIVTIYEVGEESGRYYMAMEYLDGHTLRNELDTRGFLPQDRAIEITSEILEGLEYSHNHGVVHRDIKPENIQILEDGRVKITDFGIARLTFEPNLTLDGQVFGTPSYMSPEQVVGKEIDARSDIFSVGILLFEMISGSKPFQGDNIVSISHAIMNVNPVMPQQMPYPLWLIAEKALDKTSALRWSSAKEMLQALRGFESGAQDQKTVQPAPPVQQPYNYTHNPFQTTAPPPVQGVGAGQIYTQPYGQAQPYGQPYQQPYSQPYAQPYGQQYYPPQGQQPSLPVYYPPPPRQPLISGETKQFLGKLFLTLILVSTLFVLLFVAVNAVSTSVSNEQKRRKDNQVRLKMSQGAAQSLSLDDQITAAIAGLQELSSEQAIGEAKRHIATLCEQAGKRDMQAGRLEDAEAQFLRALEYEPNNGLLYTNLGSLYTALSQVQSDSRAKASLLAKAGDKWVKAGDLLGQQGNSQYEAGAQCYYEAAMIHAAEKRIRDSRDLLIKGERFALPGGQTMELIRAALGT